MPLTWFSLLNLFFLFSLVAKRLNHLFFVYNAGSVVQGLDYDYSATAECLEEPWSVQYGGGILANPGFETGTEKWATYGQGEIKLGATKSGNKFVVAFNRENATDSFSQQVELEEGKLYAFSGWVQVNEGNATVSVVFTTPDGEMVYGGGVMAQHGCWRMLKGGIVSNFSGPSDMILKSNNTEVEIWADNVALQPFTEEQWRSHQEKTIQRVRKSVVNFHTTYTNKTRVTGAKIILRQKKPSFPIGSEINYRILTNTAYQNWLTSRFTVTAFGNEMKWYFTEKLQGQENYTVPDLMLQFAEQHQISVRGHNVIWDDPRYQPDWVTSLSPEQLQDAVQRRTDSVVSRYKGRLIHWDVVNENVHFQFYEDRLGENISAIMYHKAHEIDSKAIVFMNEYNTIEDSQDQDVTPEKYLNKLKNILNHPGNGDLTVGIGLQSRFSVGQPNLVYMRAGMDTLAATKFPLWLTEVFVQAQQNQAQYLEQVLREGYAHPAVQGIVIWPSSPLFGECKMCLTDEDFSNTPNGDVVDKLIKEWGSKNSEITLPCDGSCSVSLSRGEYEGLIWHPETNLKAALNVEVKEGVAQSFVHVELDPEVVTEISQS